jgi:hypothetical protein
LRYSSKGLFNCSFIGVAKLSLSQELNQLERFGIIFAGLMCVPALITS